MTFWGEWEPQSSVHKLIQRAQHDPQWLHTPELNLDALTPIARHLQPSCATDCTAGDGPQNTDPLVFGHLFQYGPCKQVGRYKKLLGSLSRGDIILFGSILNKTFVLDTVLVVGTHDLVRNDDKLPDWISDLYREITLDLIQVPASGLRLYGGEPWSPEKPFSFVPCLPAECLPTTGFQRPVIDPRGPLEKVINPELWPQNVNATDLDDKSADAAWEAVVQQVIAWGCALGTIIDEPHFTP